MLTYTFEDRGDMPYYEYLYVRIRQDILNGNLTAGEKLPSKRTLAGQLSVSVMTVENAYAQLMVEGYIYAVERKGYFVSDTSFLEKSFGGAYPEKDDEACHLPAQYLSKHGSETKIQSENGDAKISSVNERKTDADFAYGKEENAVGGKGVNGNEGEKQEIIADFTSNSIRPENFPFSVWAKIMRRVLTESREELLMKPPAQGMMELREAIAEHLRRFRGLQAKPEQVVVGAGTEYLYGLLIQLLGRDKTYGVENPGYRKISRIYHSNGVKYRMIGLDENGVDIGALRESGADVIHISPSHHFPTGIVTPISRRAELLAWACEQEERYIIEDDYDCEFRFTGRPIPTLAGIDRHDRVIYMNTFSKSLTPSIRISYMVLPESLAVRFREKLGFYSCTVSNFEQMTLAAFLSEGYFEKHINRLRNYYREKRDCLTNALLEEFPRGEAHIGRKEAGLHFLLQIKTKWSDDEIKDRARREGIRVTCLSDYYEADKQAEEDQAEEDQAKEKQEDEKQKEIFEYSETMTQEKKDEKQKEIFGYNETRTQEKKTGRTATLVINYSGISTENITKAAEKLRKIAQ